MRGRTLDEFFILERKKYNTFSNENVLTRMGMNAKLSLSLEILQVDLPQKQHSGLKEAMRI